MNGPATLQAPSVLRHLTTWLVAGAVSAYAAVVVIRHSTPVDEALPFIVVVLTAIAAFTHPAVQLSVPLLLGGEIVFADERQRLLWFGIVIGVAFAAGILSSASRSAAVALTLSAVVLLRWIPIDEVMIGRELAILALAVAIVVILGFTPFAVAIATAAALFTTAVPLRTLLIPIVVAGAAVAARAAGAARLRLSLTAAFAVALMLTFFSWSGAFARALPMMLGGGPPRLDRIPLQIALPPGKSAEVDVPRGARGLILSGANVPRLKKGTIVGTIQPGGIVVRIGDIADWGVLRREHYYQSRNPLPRRPGGVLRDYGQTAWIDASGRIAVPAGRVVVTADPRLPPEASLQIDAIELSR